MALTYKSPLWLIPVLFFFSSAALSAQNWTEAQLFGESRQSMQGILNTEEGLIVALTFSESFQLDDQTITSQGEEDILIFRYTAETNSTIILAGGSSREDEINAIEQDQEGNLYIAGSFWSTIDFGNFQLNSTPESPKALFLIKLNSQGDLIWSQVFTDGGSVKQINDITIDEERSIFLGGFFNDQLSFADTTLNSTANTGAFFAKFGEDGNLSWAGAFGETGDTRATVVSQYQAKQYFLGGFYDDTLKVDNQVFPANTNDEDSFILALDQAGQYNWVRKAGGVFEEVPTAMTTDKTGHIYMAGQLVGRLVVNDSLSIESRDGNADFFLIKYDSLGQAQWAYPFGGDQLQLVTDLLFHQDHLWLTGHFQENLQIGDLLIEASQAMRYDGFLSKLDSTGQALELIRINSENGPVFVNHLTQADQGVWISGDFSGKLNLNGQNLESSAGSFSSFIAQYGLPITSTQNINQPNLIRMYPNPVQHQLFIDSSTEINYLQVWNARGQMVYSNNNKPDYISTMGWGPGIYYLQVFGQKGSQTLPFVVK